MCGYVDIVPGLIIATIGMSQLFTPDQNISADFLTVDVLIVLCRQCLNLYYVCNAPPFML